MNIYAHMYVNTCCNQWLMSGASVLHSEAGSVTWDSELTHSASIVGTAYPEVPAPMLWGYK